MTEYQRIFKAIFGVGKLIRNTDGMCGKIVEVNWERNYVLISWYTGETRKLNINEEHIYIVN